MCLINIQWLAVLLFCTSLYCISNYRSRNRTACIWQKKVRFETCLVAPTATVYPPSSFKYSTWCSLYLCRRICSSRSLQILIWKAKANKRSLQAIPLQMSPRNSIGKLPFAISVRSWSLIQPKLVGITFRSAPNATQNPRLINDCSRFQKTQRTIQ